MIIEALNTAWWIMLAVQIVLIVLLTLLTKKIGKKGKKTVYLLIFLFTCVFYVWYKHYLVYESTTYSTTLLEELPLAMCQVSCIFGAVGVLSDNNILKGFDFYLGTIGSLMALLMPVSGFSGIELLSCESIGYYGFHGLVFILGILLYTMKLYNPDKKDVFEIILVTALTTLVIHGINFLLRYTGACPKANYFFTCDPENNPILQLLRGYIPINYVYLLPLLVPVALLFLLLSLILHRKGADAK